MENYFSKNLKYLREKKGLEQQELADNLGIPRSTLSCWETGVRTPKIEQIQEIADYFKVDIDIISKDYSNCALSNKIDILYNKTKDILTDDERAMIEFAMQRAIDRYEEQKRNGN